MLRRQSYRFLNMVQIVTGQLKTGHLRALQNRPL